MSSQEEEKKRERRNEQNEELAKINEIICSIPHMPVDYLFDWA
jgi:hypothetical protein